MYVFIYLYVCFILLSAHSVICIISFVFIHGLQSWEEDVSEDVKLGHMTVFPFYAKLRLVDVYFG